MSDGEPQAPHDPKSLEERIARLEQTVGELVGLTGLRGTAVPPRPPGGGAQPPRADRPKGPGVATPAPAAGTGAGRPAPARVAPAGPGAVDLEQLVGGRGLLAVGVVALLFAAGFFLKYAFDRGWIAPWLRVVGALLAGAGVAWLGERQVAAGLRRFGLALVGAGGGLVYLGLWAAAGPYALLGRQAGVALIAAATAAVFWRAVRHRAEPLALWALVGAFAAPVLLPVPDARPATYLAYMLVVCFASGAVGHLLGWRIAAGLATAGYFLLPEWLVSRALGDPSGLAYLAAGGIAAQAASRGRDWPEVRLGSLLLAWMLLIAHRQEDWWTVGAGAALLVATWWNHRGLEALRAVELHLKQDDIAVGFVLAPVAFVTLASLAGPGLLDADRAPEAAAAAAALLYLATGWRGRWAPWVAMGFALLAIAVAQQQRGAAVVAEWSAVILLATLADRRGDQRAGSGVSVVLAAVTWLLLLAGLVGRSSPERAFTGPWALALWTYLAASGLAARSWRERPEAPAWLKDGRGVLWALVGLMALTGVSIELHRFFDMRSAEWEGAGLAGNLAISVYWLLFSGALVRIGFWLPSPAVRTAGLSVAGLAALKIALYDLQNLDALYRVGSFFALAIIALAVAWAYNRRAAAAGAGGG